MRFTPSAWRAYWRTRNQFSRQASASLVGSPPSSLRGGGGAIARGQNKPVTAAGPRTVDVPPNVAVRSGDVRSGANPPAPDRPLLIVCVMCGGSYSACGCPEAVPGEERFDPRGTAR